MSTEEVIGKKRSIKQAAAGNKDNARSLCIKRRWRVQHHCRHQPLVLQVDTADVEWPPGNRPIDHCGIVLYVSGSP